MRSRKFILFILTAMLVLGTVTTSFAHNLNEQTDTFAACNHKFKFIVNNVNSRTTKTCWRTLGCTYTQLSGVMVYECIYCGTTNNEPYIENFNHSSHCPL